MSKKVVWTIPLAVFLSIVATISSADDELISLLNDHKFLSAAPVDSYGYNVFYYEVCNNSEYRTSFFWTGAGFAVDARDQLPEEKCAVKTREFTPGPVARQKSRVEMSGFNPGNVETWLPCASANISNGVCRGGLVTNIRNFFSTVILGDLAPDGKFREMETISIGLSYDETRKEGSIIVKSSSSVENIMLAFPESDLDLLRKSMDSKSKIEFGTFSYYKDTRELSGSILARDLPDNSPVISIKPTKGDRDLVVTFGDIVGLGRAMVGIIQRDNLISLRIDEIIPGN